MEFVAAVTDPDSPDFIPERDRIAVFDNDGTLWTEQPVYAQLVFALDRAAELGHPTSLELPTAAALRYQTSPCSRRTSRNNRAGTGISPRQGDATCGGWCSARWASPAPPPRPAS